MAMRSILAVDDSASMRQMVSFTLRSSGYDVIEAVDGQDALDKVGDRQVDLVLTDQNMPRMDGLTLIRQLRGQDRFKRTPILVLTTESSDEMKQAYITWIDNQLGKISSGELELCDGHTGKEYPSLGWAQQGWTPWSTAEIIYNEESS